MSEKQKKHEWAGVGPDGRNERGVVSNLVLDIHNAEVARQKNKRGPTDEELDEIVRGPIASW
ncbi:MAG: hypothetical protein V1928_01710 [Parcubacteria group bacterium]